jgi:hypothetical protein
MIPADAPPSLDGHRETTYATVHSAAPFYSTLIRINPEHPSSTTDFVCDLCTAMPQPTDDGKTYTSNIRDGVKFHDGSPLTSADVAASWNAITSRRRACTPTLFPASLGLHRSETSPIPINLQCLWRWCPCSIGKIGDSSSRAEQDECLRAEPRQSETHYQAENTVPAEDS